MAKKKDLVQIIRDNPGATAVIDNDWWGLYKRPPSEVEDDESNELITCDDDFKPLGDGGYGSGCTYGGDILQALAVIVGLKVESV